jgi:hypothetical protein
VNAIEAAGTGLAGACALTCLHESARRTVPNAPRMDVLGMRAIDKTVRAVGAEPPHGDRLHNWALGGDLVSNSLFYSLVAAGDRDGAWVRGAILGLAAGPGAVVLPGPLGLGSAPSNRTNATRLMTVGWYVAGGLAAAAAYRLLSDRSE